MALSCAKWLERYRARIVYHQPGISRELLDSYATVDTFEVMSVDFPDDPEFAVDIDPDLAYVVRPLVARSTPRTRAGRWSDSSSSED